MARVFTRQSRGIGYVNQLPSDTQMKTALCMVPHNNIWAESDYTAATKGAFVWDQSGIRIIGIMQVSVCLGAILILEYLDSILAILLPGAE